MLVTDPGFSPDFYLGYCYVPSDWYESFSHYTTTPEFLSVARETLPFSWDLRRIGIWTYASPSNAKSRKQGWKIHVSALPGNSPEILKRSIEVCVDCEVSFKFLSDPFISQTVLSKGGTREASGKFITIYPSNDSHFQLIANALHEKLSGFEGSYILSDKPYKDSQVIFYRYGAFSGYPQLSVFGYEEVLLRSPDGELTPDGRSPFFNPPPWVSNPFDSEETNEVDAPPEMTIYLKEGRYRIEEAMHFSITGGVYKAVDMDTGKTVVIKEARPHTSVELNNEDAITRLQKEHHLLTKLNGSGITPEPIDLFFDWKHLFLVEEYIPGNTLNTPVGTLDFTENANIFVERLYTIWLNLMSAVKTAHDNDLIINDFSQGNTIISDDNKTFHLIDLEAAWEEGTESPSSSFGTIGFTPPGGVKGKKGDIYSSGALIFSLIYPPVPSLFNLEQKTKYVFLDLAEKEQCISGEMKTLLLECLDSDENARPTASETLNRLENISIEPTLPSAKKKVELDDKLLGKVLDKTLDYIKSSTDFQRTDRLFPADPLVFITNPLSVAHGASGVAHALSYIEGEVPDRVISWMLTHEISGDNYPPGLYLGLSGIAWMFWKLGLKELSLKLMKIASNHPLLWDLSDLYYGATGFGLACLHFYRETEETYWLEQATRVGDKLIKTKSESDKGFYWPDMSGNVWSGYARGASGISLFLLYLYLLTGDIRFKESGRCALDYDLGQAVELEDKMRIPRATPDSVSPNHQHVYSHYLSDGTAGVCTALLRYLSVFGEDSDKDILEQLMPDTTRNYTAFPTLLTGLAGLGNLQLDAFNFTGEAKYVSSAFYVTDGMLRFQIERPEGIAFPGEQLYRISNDFISGSSGIAMFLYRLINREKHLPNFMFMLDDLLRPSK
ncbi:MAG: class III lanthionine synthetase LanKC [Candidatus Poribacteria bacterium]|nr:class III lanthionine synthetase LanKC [Candidatus Poribacteria bacterium]